LDIRQLKLLLKLEKLLNDMLICGAGGHAKVVIDCLADCKIPVTAIFDTNSVEKIWLNIPIVGDYDPDFEREKEIIIAIGDNKVRKRLSRIIQHTPGLVVHPSVLIGHHTEIGGGTVVFHHSVIQINTKIGRHCIINTAASIDHDCIIEDFVHISPNSTLCGAVQVGEGTHIGAGAVVIPGIKIGAWSVIGAGAVIIENVPDYTMVVGNPAQVIKSLK
jgi:sugar O-acyltransferase (sialic acid O-acetyltransferase NeuD family)